jgi:hypothetical protein
MSIADRYVHTVWCDDIRQEIGNKPSFMGVFTGGMVLPSLPAVLSRLGIYTWFVSPLDRPATDIEAEVVRDDGYVIATVRPELSREPEPVVEGASRRQILIAMIIGPIEIPEGCKWFEVRVKADGQTYEGPKLRVHANEAQFATLMGAQALPHAQDQLGLPG